MKNATILQLLSLNKQFYQTFGREFSSTRGHLQPGVLRMLDGLAGDETLLDLGCGNGELAREMLRRGHRGRYVGLDFSLPLLEVARQGWEDAPATFIRADLTRADWEKKIAALLIQPFDLVTAFAVLHHIPGQEMRLDTLNKVHGLLRSGGQFIHSEWQFMQSEKYKGRIQPWESAGLSPEQVEQGDALLDWRSGGHGLRYVHQFTETELEALASASRFRICRTFHSDGKNGQLGLYQVWEPLASSG